MTASTLPESGVWGRPSASGRRHRIRTGRVRTVGVAISAGFLALMVSACGVPTNSAPSALPKSGVPFGLLGPSSPTSTTPAVSPVEVPVQIYFVGPGGRLVAVARDVPVAAPGLATVLGALVDGPTDAEAAAGLQNYVPTQTVILGAMLASGVATVNLAGTFGQLVGQTQIDAVAQIVFTATALPDVTGVAFQLNGQAVDVPVANGAEVAEATPAQFASLAPVAPTASLTGNSATSNAHAATSAA